MHVCMVVCVHDCMCACVHLCTFIYASVHALLLISQDNREESRSFALVEHDVNIHATVQTRSSFRQLVMGAHEYHADTRGELPFYCVSGWIFQSTNQYWAGLLPGEIPLRLPLLNYALLISPRPLGERIKVRGITPILTFPRRGGRD